MNMTAARQINNIGRIDALLRFTLGMLMLAAVISLDLGSTTQFLLTMVSVPTTLFALLRWDPIYHLLGLRTGEYTLPA